MSKKHNISGALDKPDVRDYNATHILGGGDGDLPSNVYLMPEIGLKVKNQGNTPHCTAYATALLHEGQNRMEHKSKDIIFEGEDMWNNQVDFPGTTTDRGDYSQSSLKSLMKFGLDHNDKNYPAKGYARVFPIDFQLRLSQGFFIYVILPSTETNWINARETGNWSGLDGTVISYHQVLISGYDDEAGHYICPNSWGENWGHFKDGTFRIPYEYIKDVGSAYIVYDQEDIDYIFKDVSSKSPDIGVIRWGADNDIIEGYKTNDPEHDQLTDRLFAPDQQITRIEALKMIHRMYLLLSEKLIIEK